VILTIVSGCFWAWAQFKKLFLVLGPKLRNIFVSYLRLSGLRLVGPTDTSPDFWGEDSALAK
jgi:hypothetical protein